MNKIVNTFLLAGDKFMLEMHLKQPGSTYRACGPFTGNKQRIKKFMQTGDTNYIYKNKLDKACFQYDMAYGKYNKLEKRTQSDKFLKDEAFAVANNPKCDEYQRGLVSMVYKVFDKKSKGSGIKNEIKENQQLAEVYSSIKDDIWGVDLADMLLISKYNKGIRYILCAIDLFSKYAFVVPLTKKELLLLMHFRQFFRQFKKITK